MKRSSALLPAALAMAVAIAGCGNGQSSPGTAANTATTATSVAAPAEPKQPTKASYIAQADRSCKRTNHRLKPIIQRIIRLDLSPQPLAFRLSGYRDSFHDLGIEYEDLVAELQQLDAPRRDHRLVTRMLRLMDEIPLHLDRIQAAITDLDGLSLLRAEVKINHTFIRLGGTADSYGFHVCGVIPTRKKHDNRGPFPGARHV